VPKRSLKPVGCNQQPATRRASPHSPRAAIRLFLLGERAINRETLRLLFAAESDFRVVGSITHWADVSRAHARHADVVVVDLSNPGMPDATALRALTRICASTRVIVLTPGFDRSQITEALRLGVRGIVANTVCAELLFKCVRVVAAGQYWVERDIIVDLTQRLSAATSSAVDAPRRNTFGLTGRELQVVSLLIAGHANKVIADRFGIRERTVRQHLTNMFDKVGVSNRLELALFALQQRLIFPVAAARRGGAFPR
jgi:two-component system nitrate/nitrite response regulator NarL